MVIKLIDDKFNHKLYNQKTAHPFQSWEYGEVQKKMGYSIIRIGEFEKKRLKKTHQIVICKTPFSKYNLGYLPQSFFPNKQLVNFLLKNNRTKKLTFIKVIPYLDKSKKLKAPKNIVKAPYNLQPNFTIKINLNQKEQNLWKNLKKNTRYSIRQAQKKQIYVKEMTNEEGFKIFFKILSETGRKKGFYFHSRRYHQLVFSLFKNNVTNIFVAFYKKTPIAVCEVFKLNKGLYLFYSGMKKNYKAYYGPSLLIWEIIKFDLKKNLAYFDFGGAVPLDDKNHPWWGLTKFKLGFGGTLVELVDDYDLVINKNKYFKYKNIFLKVKKNNQNPEEDQILIIFVSLILSLDALFKFTISSRIISSLTLRSEIFMDSSSLLFISFTTLILFNSLSLYKRPSS